MIKLLEVTQDDIDKGIRKNFFYCPIARAAERLFPEANKIEVDGSITAWIGSDQNHYIVCHNDPTLVQFMNNFDNGKEVFPFSLSLDFFEVEEEDEDEE